MIIRSEFKKRAIHYFLRKLGVKLSFPFKSPFRIDKNPSCSIVNSTSPVIYDFSTGKAYDYLELASVYYQVPINIVEEYIIKDYNEILKCPVIELSDNKKDIKYKARALNSKEIKILKEYGLCNPTFLLKLQSIEWDHFPENSFVIKDAYEDYLKGINTTNQVFCPFAPKSSRYLNIAGSNPCIIGWKDLVFTAILFITKGIKDYDTLKSMTNYDTLAVLSENNRSIDNILPVLCKYYKTIFIIFDSDETGKKRSYQLSNQENIFSFNIEGIDLFDLKQKIIYDGC